MKLLFLSDRYLPIVGGAERQAAALADGLMARGHTVTMLTRRVTPKLALETTINGLPVRRLHPIGLSKRSNALIVPRLMAYLLRYGRAYDVWQTFGVGPVGLAALLAGRLTGRPVVLRADSPGAYVRGDHVGIDPPLYTRLVRRYVLTPSLWRSFLQQADAIIAISAEIEAEARSLDLTSKVHRIPNGVDTSRWYPDGGLREALRARFDLPREAFALISAGRLVAGKRLDVAIDVLARLPSHVHLYLAGSGAHQSDDVSAALREQVARLDLAERVHFLGLRDDLPDWYRAVDAFVFPTAREGMPVALLEAMASGLPVVASDVEGVRGVLPDEHYGWLCPVGDVDAFTAVLRQSIEQPDEARRRAHNALQHVQAYFSQARVLMAYENLYQGVIETGFCARNVK